jgi:hypothetical protein
MSLGVGKCIPWVEEKGLFPGLGPWRLEKSWGMGVEGKVGARNSGAEGASGFGAPEAGASGFLSLGALPETLGPSWEKGFLGLAKAFCGLGA